MKGGFALELRLPERARVTKDVALDWMLADEAATSALIDAARLARHAITPKTAKAMQ